MLVVQTWTEVLGLSFRQLGDGDVSFVPQLIVALVVFIIGWIIAVALGKVVEQIIKAIKVDMALRSLGMEEAVSSAGMKLDSGAFIGGLVRWFFILVFLFAAIDVLGLTQVTEFLRSVVLTYVPQVIVASLILVAAALLAEVMHRIVSSSARAAHLPAAGFVGGVTKWSIWIFAILAALFQLGIAGVF